jgi:hypothetical protein
MTSRQESRLFWNLVCGCGLVLCALPLFMPSARYPLVPFGAGLLLVAVALLQRWRIRRRRQRTGFED